MLCCLPSVKTIKNSKHNSSLNPVTISYQILSLRPTPQKHRPLIRNFTGWPLSCSLSFHCSAPNGRYHIAKVQEEQLLHHYSLRLSLYVPLNHLLLQQTLSRANSLCIQEPLLRRWSPTPRSQLLRAGRRFSFGQFRDRRKIHSFEFVTDRFGNRLQNR